MSYANPIWIEGRRRYWLRHDAHLFARPDASAYRSHASRLVEQRRQEEEQAAIEAERKAFETGLLEVRRQLAEVKFELAWRSICRKYSADQPRVPKGNPDGGQWTKEGGGDAGKDGGERAVVTQDASMRPRGGREPPRQPGKIPRSVAEWLVPRVETPEQERARANRLADDVIRKVREVDPTWEPKPSLYEANVEGDTRKGKDLVLEAEARLVELGHQSPQQLIEIYRAQRNSIDLLGQPTWPFEKDVVAVTIFDGVPIFGTNSGAPPYTDQDQRWADTARDLAFSQDTGLNRENAGWAPNNGFYHAEATVLSRTARANGGSLEGRVIEVYVDDRMCRTSCPIVLPILGRQLGNPTVTFVDKFGKRRTMSDGFWK